MFSPLTRLTTAITDVTPITTPSSVSTLRILCAHRLAVAIRTASPIDMEVLQRVFGAIGVPVGSLYYTREGHPKLHAAGE